MSQPPKEPIPVATPYPGAPRRKGMPVWGILLITLGAVALILVPVIVLILATIGNVASQADDRIGYAVFVANKGMCKHKLKGLAVVSKVLHTLDDGPLGAKWIEGFDWTPPDPADPNDAGAYSTAIANDNIKKSRLAFWRMIADPEIVDLNVSPGGPQAFLCPGSTKPKQPAQLVINGTTQRDFADPRRELFYSMFNQGLPGIVPNFGTNVCFVVMGDRSPQDDGYALDANSGNHRWGNENTGQNICYSSGNVDWAEDTCVGIDEDEIYMAGSGRWSGMRSATTVSTTDVPEDTDDTVLMPVAP